MYVSVIVPAKDEEKYLGDCLESLKNQVTAVPYEIIVVDCDSDDRTRAIAWRYADKIVAAGHRNTGAARNLGVKHSSGDIIAFMDADTYVSHRWIEEISRSFKRKDGVIAVFGPVYAQGARPKGRLVYNMRAQVQHGTTLIRFPYNIDMNCAFDKAEFLKAGGFSDVPYDHGLVLGLKLGGRKGIVYSKDMKSWTSTRRLDKEGVWRLLWAHIVNRVRILLTGESSEYPRVG